MHSKVNIYGKLYKLIYLMDIVRYKYLELSRT